MAAAHRPGGRHARRSRRLRRTRRSPMPRRTPPPPRALLPRPRPARRLTPRRAGGRAMSDFLDLFSLPFMQRALIAALLTGLAAPAIGTFLVQRRLALLGDGIGHVAVTGVAIGLLTGASPTWTAVVVAVLGAVLIEIIRERGHTNGDVALALLFYGGLAGGVLITGLAGQSASRLQEYLFGSLTSISAGDVWFVRRPRCRAAGRHAGPAPPALRGVPATRSSPAWRACAVRAYNLLIAVLAAVTVTVAMRTVGLLLVSALMVVPVATSQQLTRSFRTTLLGAVLRRRGRGRGRAAAQRGAVLPGHRGTRPDDRAAGAGDVRVHVADRRLAAAPPPTALALPRRRGRRRTRSPTSTRTRTARTAGTGPCRTATTSTTCTTATATPCTESTMTSTDRPAVRPTPPAPRGRGRPDDVRRLPQRPGDPRPDHAAGRLGRTGHGLPHPAGLAESGEVDMLRNEDGEAIWRSCSDTHHHHLVCRSCGATIEVEGPAVERWTARDRGRARLRRHQPHAGDLRHLPDLPLSPQWPRFQPEAAPHAIASGEQPVPERRKRPHSPLRRWAALRRSAGRGGRTSRWPPTGAGGRRRARGRR